MSDDAKPITIILTIHPPKKAKRRVDVAAAPEGEMPLLLTGDFAHRHALADQAYATLLKRKPQTVKAASNGSGKKKSTTAATPSLAEPDDEGDATETPAEPETGPVGPVLETEPDLPIIEGDGPEQLNLMETPHG